ncbi:hypothetical protein [uncultured Winogradskyella sp.]|uniref:hypothetical protein n=1 Tax=uncultured Winogradskyella sp. TaxID=395353 RepID=UPI00262A94A5|nr:hypothetical protein [uncultured Winogradskyella sp.]
MGIVEDKTITLFESLDDISIYRFDKCMHGHLKYMIASYEYGIQKLYPIETKIVWDKLYDKWCVLTGDLESAQVYTLACEIDYLKNLMAFVPVLMMQLIKGCNNENEVIEELRSWRFIIDKEKDIISEIERLGHQLRATESKLNMKLDDYEELNKKDVKPMTLQQQKVRLERALGVSIRIKKTSATEWLAYCNELQNLKPLRTNE